MASSSSGVPRTASRAEVVLLVVSAVAMLGVSRILLLIAVVVLGVVWSVARSGLSFYSRCQYIRLQKVSTEKANLTLYARALVSEMSPLRAIP
jgi:uncharacterized metal-binding protein